MFNTSASKQKKVLVLGGGQQGKIIAEDFLHMADVTIADLNPVTVKSNSKNYGDAKYIFLDAKDVDGGYRSIISQWWKTFDVIIGALPSHLGGSCVKLAAESGIHYVDLSFTTDSLSKYHDMAMFNNCTIIHDCGFAPGLPNLILGKYLGGHANESINDVEILVGGIAKNPNVPLGYVETWSVEDLWEEYTRPARIIHENKIKRIEPTYGQNNITNHTLTFSKHHSILNFLKKESLDFEMEAFTSDGLRSLLSLGWRIKNMTEKTLRWPGHMATVEQLISNPDTCKKSDFVNAFREKLDTNEKDDMILMKIFIDDKEVASMLDFAKDGKSAMARCTGWSCSAFGRLILSQENDRQNSSLPRGITTPEIIGLTHSNLIINHLTSKGIDLRVSV